MTWTAPACASEGTTPTVTVTNTYHLTTTWSFRVSGLPGCGALGSPMGSPTD